ncbi:MAG TPA: hypothetical protein VNL38_01450 [Candidatus Nitrosotenuis sp.]|nr:hypothetical protein [Candidatus Nitrosotenuis sp.]
MSEHYTSNTEAVSKFCNTCGRVTQHAVSGHRLGRCMNDHAAARSATADLRSKTCVCGAKKREGESFCFRCYDELTPELKRDLWKKAGHGYVKAYAAALDFLRWNTTRLQGEGGPEQTNLFGGDAA